MVTSLPGWLHFSAVYVDFNNRVVEEARVHCLLENAAAIISRGLSRASSYCFIVLPLLDA